MICTYCGRDHTAASCPLRPRWQCAPVIVLALGLGIGGCSSTPPVPPAALAPPPAELMVAPAALEPIPACEGEKACRIRHYARTRTRYAETAERLRGLQRWVRLAGGK